MDLFDYLKGDHHQVGMDNIYNSSDFCRAAYHHDRKVLCHVVALKDCRGIPECLIQDEENNPVAQQAAQCTVKEDVLEVYPGCKNLIASSMYDIKPVHYLSMVYESIQWVDKDNMV